MLLYQLHFNNKYVAVYLTIEKVVFVYVLCAFCPVCEVKRFERPFEIS